MQVELVAVPDGATVINVEKLGELSGVRGQFRSRCDYLVLFRKAGADAAAVLWNSNGTLGAQRGPAGEAGSGTGSSGPPPGTGGKKRRSCSPY